MLLPACRAVTGIPGAWERRRVRGAGHGGRSLLDGPFGPLVGGPDEQVVVGGSWVAGVPGIAVGEHHHFAGPDDEAAHAAPARRVEGLGVGGVRRIEVVGALFRDSCQEQVAVRDVAGAPRVRAAEREPAGGPGCAGRAACREAGRCRWSGRRRWRAEAPGGAVVGGRRSGTALHMPKGPPTGRSLFVTVNGSALCGLAVTDFEGGAVSARWRRGSSGPVPPFWRRELWAA